MNKVAKQINLQTRKLLRKSRKAKGIGLPPGSLVHTGVYNEKPVSINVYSFAPNTLNEYHDIDIHTLKNILNHDYTTWIQVIGVHDAQIIKEIGEIFSIQSLVLEDVMNTHQRTKHERYSDYDFFVQNIPYRSANNERFTTEQISLIAFQEHTVISFQERDTEIFNSLKVRIRDGSPRLRNLGSPYLCYALLDIAVDSLFPVLDEIFEESEHLEEEIITSPKRDTLLKTHILRHNLNICRKCIWATKEITGNLIRETNTNLSTEIKL